MAEGRTQAREPLMVGSTMSQPARFGEITECCLCRERVAENVGERERGL